jgi:hypothetical protein
MIRQGQSALYKRNGSRVGVPMWVGLGVILVAFLIVIAGCGSDSGSPKTPTTKKLADKKLEVKKGLGQSGESQERLKPVYGVVLEGMTQEELKDKQAAGMKRLQDSNTEVLPGLTMEAKQAKEAAAAKQLQGPDLQVIPGVTMEAVNAKRMEAAKQLQGPDLQVIPGVTMEAVNAKRMEAAKQLQNPDLIVLPGLTAGALAAKQEEYQKLKIEVPPPPSKKP